MKIRLSFPPKNTPYQSSTISNTNHHHQQVKSKKNNQSNKPNPPLPLPLLTHIPHHQPLLILLDFQKLLIHNFIHLPHKPLILEIFTTLFVFKGHLVEGHHLEGEV